MSKDIRKWLANYDKAVQITAKEIQAYANKELKRVNKTIMQRCGQFQKEKIKEVFNKSVSDFYGAYTPTEYKRSGNTGSQSGGLFDVLDKSMNTDENGMPMYSSTKDLYKDGGVLSGRNGEDIFDTVFIQGYHGGAKDKSGTYRYRRPIPYYNYWGKEAVSSKSPDSLFYDNLLSAENKEISTEFQRIKQEEYEKLSSNVASAWDAIFTDAFEGV